MYFCGPHRLSGPRRVRFVDDYGTRFHHPTHLDGAPNARQAGPLASEEAFVPRLKLDMSPGTSTFLVTEGKLPVLSTAIGSLVNVVVRIFAAVPVIHANAFVGIRNLGVLSGQVPGFEIER